MKKSTYIIVSLFSAMLLLGGNSWAEEQIQSPDVNEKYEMDSWTSAKDINTIEAYEVYLSEHANGRHVKFAHAAINKIKNEEKVDDIETQDTHPAKQSAVAPAATSAVVAAPVVAEVPASGGSVETKSAPVAEMPATPSSNNGAQKP